MLTRLRVEGFKNLVGVDVHFGPFTCIAGSNGVGKSNLFDAIRFLSTLADRSFLDAAKSVRDESARSGEVRSLFTCSGGRYRSEMQFIAEMIVPRTGIDLFGQLAEAKATFLEYSLKIRHNEINDTYSGSPLELIEERLTYIPMSDVRARLKFPVSSEWKKTAIHWDNRRSPFISTEGDSESTRKVLLHAEGGGRPQQRPARQLPRSVLSGANALEAPTASLARKEMQSWRFLHLEPVALRRSDELDAPRGITAEGGHLPSTLYSLATSKLQKSTSDNYSPSDVYNRAALRLSKLNDGIQSLRIDRDDKRQLLSILATDRNGTDLPARALSDGTLRFLALAVLELDPQAIGVLCLEEPENGIHPERVPEMIDLLQDIAVDTDFPISAENPFRQVIVNTHSSAVVACIDPHDMLVARQRSASGPQGRFQQVEFLPYPRTWRTQFQNQAPAFPLGLLKGYLRPSEFKPKGHRNRMIDRPEIRSLFDGMDSDE